MTNKTPQTFTGIHPWYSYDYINSIIEEAQLDDCALICEDPLNILDNKAINQIASFLKYQAEKNDKAVILGPLKSPGTQHVVSLLFKFDSSPKELVYCDPSGERMKTDMLAVLKKVVEAAELTGQFEVKSQVDIQQTQDQPNTCVAWGAKNAFDFLTTGTIDSPKNCFEATKAIQPYLDKAP